jgi:hypothetical protein
LQRIEIILEILIANNLNVYKEWLLGIYMVNFRTVKDLRESAVKLIQRVMEEKDELPTDIEKLENQNIRNIMPHALSWTQISRGIIITFFDELWKRAFSNSSSEAMKTKWFLDQYLKISDPDTPSKKIPPLMMNPFNDSKIPLKERYERLLKIFDMAFKGKGSKFLPYLIKMVEDKDAKADILVDNKERRLVFRLKNIAHAVDAEADANTQKKLKNQIEEMLVQSDFDKRIIQITELVSVLHFVVEYLSSEKTSNDPELQSMDKLMKNEHQRLVTELADTGNIRRTRGILERIRSMKWGPKEFVRHPDVIARAHDILCTHGLLTLTGVGAVGKTALANKLLETSANNDEYSRYIFESSKVNSGQGTLDPDAEGYLSATDSTNSLMNSMLNPEGNFISGSMRRVCCQIIASVDPEFEGRHSSIDDLIELAIRSMRENSILVCIDNFEDIEDPQVMPIEMASKVNKEYEYFQKFFREWSTEYRKIRDKSSLNGKQQSRIIITTRGKGDKTENESYAVPPLSSSENYELFIKKLESRFRDDLIEFEIISDIQNRKTEIERKFEAWTLPENENEIHKYQPAYTIFAASGIKEIAGTDGIMEQIEKWDPAGISAEHIRSYVTSKIFGEGYDECELHIFAKLLIRGLNHTFNIHIIRDIVSDSDYDSWLWTDANKFIREYSSHRDFFIETKIGGEYIWNRFYFKEIKEHFNKKHPEYFESETEDELIEQISPPEVEIVKEEERRLLRTWLSTNEPSTQIKESNKTFNQIIVSLKKEEHLSDIKVARALIMLIGNGELCMKEENIEKLFVGKPPSNCVFDVFKRPTKKSVGTTNKGGKDSLGNTKATNFIDTNFPHTWEYFTLIYSQCSSLLKNYGMFDHVLRLFENLHHEVEKCLESGLISIDAALEFYNFALQEFASFPKYENADYQSDLFDGISFNIMNKYLNHLNVVPKHISEDLSDTPELNNHYLELINFVDIHLRFDGRQESLIGKLFWVALRYIASQNVKGKSNHAIYTDYNRGVLEKIEDWTEEGLKLAKSFNPHLLKRKKERVLSNFSQVVWTFGQISNNEITRQAGGIIGKLVLYKNGEKLNIKHDIKPLLDGLNEEQERKLLQKKHLYRIQQITPSSIFISPVLNDENELLTDSKKLIEFTRIEAEMKKYFEDKIKSLTAPMLWSKIRNTLPHKNLFLELGENNDEEKQIQYLQNCLFKEPIDPLYIHTNSKKDLYINRRDFTEKDKQSLQKFAWEDGSVPKELLDMMSAAQNPGSGVGLLRDPALFAKIFISFISDSNKSKTYQDIIELYPGVEEPISSTLAYNLYRVANRPKSKVEPGWRYKPMNSKPGDVPEQVWKEIQRRYQRHAHYLYRDKISAYPFTTVLDKYFLEVQGHFPDKFPA